MSNTEATPTPILADPGRCLQLLLRVFAAILLLAFVPVFFPFAWMDAIHDQLGIGRLPDQTIVDYLARSASMLYGTMGIYYLVVSFDLPRYAPLVAVFCWVKIILGIGLLVLDAVVGMPWFWVLAEGPVVMSAGGAMLWLLRSWQRDQLAAMSFQPSRSVDR